MRIYITIIAATSVFVSSQAVAQGTLPAEQHEYDALMALQDEEVAEFESVKAAAIANGAFGFMPEVVAWSYGSQSNAWAVLSFEMGQNYEWIAKRTKGGVDIRWSDPPEHTPTSTSWARGKSCEAIVPALAALEAVPPPPINVSGIQDDDDRFIVSGDGTSLGVWVSLQSESTFLDYVEFGSDVATPLGDWFYATMDGLEPCWSQEAPTAD